MPPSGSVDQPLTGFGYDYWFECVGCGVRVEITAGLYEQQCIGAGDFSKCQRCSITVDITRESPTLRNVDDVALQNDSVDQLVWYHSSRYKCWPDVQAYTAEMTELAGSSVIPFVDPVADVEHLCALALHLGTYEGAIENVLRRLDTQDCADIFEVRYWLHRVEVSFDGPGDLHPQVGPELEGSMGNVALAQLRRLGARAARYVNLHEAVGSVSLAIDPAVIRTVATIELPVEDAALPEMDVAARATATMTGEVDPIGSWDEFVATLRSAYLPGVNEDVSAPFLNAVGDYEDPAEFHRRFRVLAGLLLRPEVVVAKLAAAPRRRLGGG